MPGSSKWTDEAFVAALIAAHGCWLTASDGKQSGCAFGALWITHHGLNFPYTLFRRAGHLPRIIARLPPEVRADLSTRRSPWTRPAIEQAFRFCFSKWEQDAVHGKLAGTSWGRAYMIRRGYESLIRSLEMAKLQPEAFLNAMGGEIATLWVRGWHAWDPERAREAFAAAYAQWKDDARSGKPAERSFNVQYLIDHGYRWLVRMVYVHWPGKWASFARTVPQVMPDWSMRMARVPTAHVRRDLIELHTDWEADPIGKAVGFPFGPMYLGLKKRGDLIAQVRKRGVARVLGGADARFARDDWGRRIPGMCLPKQRAERAKLRRLIKLRSRVHHDV